MKLQALLSVSVLSWAGLAVASPRPAESRLQISPKARCGPNFGYTCKNSDFGNCKQRHVVVLEFANMIRLLSV